MVARAETARSLDLPPPYRLVTLREAGDAFAHARAIAAEAGAGTLVHVGRYDLVEFALVLEPEEPLGAARRVLYAGLVALADAIGAQASPEKSVRISWPDTLLYDGARIGGARLAWPEGCAETEIPDWLIFGAQILAARLTVDEGGLYPESTSLLEEGIEDGDAILSGFARHLMVHLDDWTERGFDPIGRAYLQRLTGIEDFCRLDGAGNLLVGQGADVRRHDLVRDLARPGWYDPARRGPRL